MENQPTIFEMSPYLVRLSYGPSDLYLNKFGTIFGDYQYAQEYLDVYCYSWGDWYLNGELQQTNVQYDINVKVTLGPDIIDQWGVDDNLIVSASAAHFGYTVIFE